MQRYVPPCEPRSALAILVLTGLLSCAFLMGCGSSEDPAGPTGTGGAGGSGGGTGTGAEGGAGGAGAGGSGSAACESGAEPSPLSETEAVFIRCASSDAELEAPPNFNGFEHYFGGGRDVSADGSAWQFRAGFGIKQADDWMSVLGEDFAFDAYGEDDESVRWSGLTDDGRGVELALDHCMPPDTQLRDATLTLADDTYALTCHVGPIGGGDRGMCEPFGYPGEGVIAPVGQFIVSFLGEPDTAHVDQVMDPIRASPNVEQVTQISGQPDSNIWIFEISFNPGVPHPQFRAEVLQDWCAAADDLRVDYDAAIVF